MRNKQVDMPPLASFVGGQEHEYRASRRLSAVGHRAQPKTNSRHSTAGVRDDFECTFAGIDSELVRSKPLVAAIAREICENYGGNEVLNWLEAEILLENALSERTDHVHRGKGLR